MGPGAQVGQRVAIPCLPRDQTKNLLSLVMLYIRPMILIGVAGVAEQLGSGHALLLPLRGRERETLLPCMPSVSRWNATMSREGFRSKSPFWYRPGWTDSTREQEHSAKPG